MGQRAWADEKVQRRGITHFCCRPELWEALGCPTVVPMPDGSHVPITPTGRKPNWFSWFYKRLRPRARR